MTFLLKVFIRRECQYLSTCCASHLSMQCTNNHKLYFLCENLNDRSISKASYTWNDQMLSACLGGIIHPVSGHANQEQLPNLDLGFQCLHWDFPPEVFLGCFSITLVLLIFLDRENEAGRFIPKTGTGNIEQHKTILKRSSLGRIIRITICKPLKTYTVWRLENRSFSDDSRRAMWTLDLVSGFMCSKMYRSFLREMLKYASFGQIRITRKIKRRCSLKKLWPLHLFEMVSTPFCVVGGRGHTNVSLASQIQILNQRNLQQSHQCSLLHLK